jgi:hypothetical protein
MKINPYLVLNVSPSATKQEIMLAFTQAVKHRRHSISDINKARAELLNPTDRLFADLLRPLYAAPHRYKNIESSEVLPEPGEDPCSIISLIPIYESFFDGLIFSSLDSKIVELQSEGRQLFEAFQERMQSSERAKSLIHSKSNVQTTADWRKSLNLIKYCALTMSLFTGLGFLFNHFSLNNSSNTKSETSLPRRSVTPVVPKIKNANNSKISGNQIDGKAVVFDFKASCGSGGPWIVVGPATHNLRATVYNKFCGDAFVNSSGQLQVARMNNRSDADNLAEMLTVQLRVQFYVTEKSD